MDPTNKYKGTKHLPGSPSQGTTNNNFDAVRENHGSVISTDGGTTDLVKMFAKRQSHEDGAEGDSEMFPGVSNPTALECLEEANQLFNLAETEQDKICSFNIAKV